jgi:SAM-dependent methyltransferase
MDAQSTIPAYHEITTCTESYFDREGDSPLGMGWPNTADAITRYQVMLDVIRERHDQPVRLLDFGCGLGHLYEYIQAHNLTHIHYQGIDLSERFIAECQRKHPAASFQCLDILKDPEQLPDFDYAVINGVFTSKCSMSFQQMFQFVQQVISVLYDRAAQGIAFNAMSKHVDWERDDLFHLPLDDIAAFACRRLSRNFVIRNDYGLYEFTTYVYKSAVGAR